MYVVLKCCLDYFEQFNSTYYCHDQLEVTLFFYSQMISPWRVQCLYNISSYGRRHQPKVWLVPSWSLCTITTGVAGTVRKKISKVCGKQAKKIADFATKNVPNFESLQLFYNYNFYISIKTPTSCLIIFTLKSRNIMTCH